MLALLTAVLLTAAPADAASIRAVLTPAPAPGWSISAVRLGVSPRAKRKTFIADPTLGPHVEIAFAFWVLRGFDRVVLVDAGFVDRRWLVSWGIQGYREPTAALAALGLTAAEVTDVVVTHAHWDHIGGLVTFPGAQVWIDRRALAEANVTKDEGLRQALAAAERDGRLHLTESLQAVAPHLVVVHAGLHARGFQYLVVGNPDGPWVLASDLAPLTLNFERNRPTGLTTSAEATLAVMAVMRELVGGNLARIVPGHEPAGFDDQGVRRFAP